MYAVKPHNHTVLNQPSHDEPSQNSRQFQAPQTTSLKKPVDHHEYNDESTAAITAMTVHLTENPYTPLLSEDTILQNSSNSAKNSLLFMYDKTIYSHWPHRHTQYYPCFTNIAWFGRFFIS